MGEQGALTRCSRQPECGDGVVLGLGFQGFFPWGDGGVGAALLCFLGLLNNECKHKQIGEKGAHTRLQGHGKLTEIYLSNTFSCLV